MVDQMVNQAVMYIFCQETKHKLGFQVPRSIREAEAIDLEYKPHR